MRPVQDSVVVFPVWVFRRGAEVGGDAALWYNNFGRPCLKRRQRIEVEAVLDRLRRAIHAGGIPLGGAAVGWPGVVGVRPPNAADTTDPAVMRAWFRRTFVIVLPWDEIVEPAAVSTFDVKDVAMMNSTSYIPN
jgi:hypothetical protein